MRLRGNDVVMPSDTAMSQDFVMPKRRSDAIDPLRESTGFVKSTGGIRLPDGLKDLANCHAEPGRESGCKYALRRRCGGTQGMGVPNEAPTGQLRQAGGSFFIPVRNKTVEPMTPADFQFPPAQGTAILRRSSRAQGIVHRRSCMMPEGIEPGNQPAIRFWMK